MVSKQKGEGKESDRKSKNQHTLIKDIFLKRINQTDQEKCIIVDREELVARGLNEHIFHGVVAAECYLIFSVMEDLLWNDIKTWTKIHGQSVNIIIATL